MPHLIDHQFDFYFNGHEHTLEYAFYPHTSGSALDKQAKL